MAIERTLSIVKPDAVGRNIIGEVEARLEKAGLKIIAMKMIHLAKSQAESFYDIHRGKPFFEDLVKFMISGPCIVQVLEGDNAVMGNRDVMGATDPKKAAPGTIRRDFAECVDANCVHGSDSVENAKREISFFFSECEICPR